ncbi:TonB-dependent receptor [Caulobacter sp. KR2-114]|uniref:TonB-dependent receptor n=1 Tax=Caulobacter sp. KR2-114 TaxID=3400912 RepID=UPI003C036736
MRSGTTAGLAALLTLPMAPACAAAATDGPAAGQAQIGEVVVTAAKRETTVQRLPQAISVLNGGVQRDRGQQRLEDLQTSVPNITFASTSDNAQLYIRGVGNTFINAGGDPGVAFYQDGAYVSDQRTTNTSMFDVERVEVLRGPQGALYGRNAVGGALNIISARPTDSFQGRVDAIVGDYGRRESEGFVSGPLIAGAAGEGGVDARLSYQVRHLDGYTRNLLAGQAGAPARLDDLDAQAVRGQISAKLPGGGRLNLLASYYHQDDAGPALAVVPVAGFTYPTQLIFGLAPSTDPRAVYADVGIDRLKVATVQLSYVQPIGEASLTALVNYRHGRQYFLNDCDGTAAEGCRYSTATHSDDVYAETYLTSPGGGRLRWTLGATGLRFDQGQSVEVPWQTSAAWLGAGGASDPFFIDYIGGGTLAVRSAAIYADLRYQLTPVWAVSAQARYSETTKRAVEFQTIASFGVDVSGFRNRLKNTSAPFKVAIEGRLAPDVLVYASYATAYKDGAINIGALQTTAVRPEQVRSWEIGEKASFLDRRLQVNAAIFDSRYRDLQIAQVVGTIATLANAPRSRIRGGEIEAVALPARGLRLSASLGYLDARFEQFSNSQTIPGAVSGPLQNLAGNRLPYVPSTTVNLDVQYGFTLGAGLRSTLDAQYAWRSRTYFNEFDDPANAAPAGGVLNLAASIGPERGPWRLYGYVHNLADRTYQTGSTIYSGLLGGEKAVNYAPPRNFALGISYSF